MAWRRRATEVMADILRFAVRGALLIDGIMISLASIWIVAKLCWFSTRYLDRVVFSAPW